MSCSFENSCKIKKQCPIQYCQFSDEENADKILDLIDEYIELKEESNDSKGTDYKPT